MTEVTSSERILIYLLSTGNGVSDEVNPCSQESIALNCGIGRTHVPRALKPLVEDDLVREDMGRMPGKSRRLKVYSLSGKGAEEANILLQGIRSREVVWEDDSGKERKETVQKAVESVNETLVKMGREKIPLSLFLAMVNERVTWNDLLWTSGSLSSMVRRSKSTLRGWDPVMPPRVPEPFVDRESEMEAMRRSLEVGDEAIVIGDDGLGKKSLVSRFLEEEGMRGLWLKRGESEISVKEADYDAVVIMDSSMPDPADLIMGREPIKEDEEIQNPIEGKPLILIREYDRPGRPGIHIGGVPEGHFIRELVKNGIEGELASKLYRASDGSPSVISYFNSLGEDEVERIKRMNEEDAVLSVLLRLKEDRVKNDTN